MFLPSIEIKHEDKTHLRLVVARIKSSLEKATVTVQLMDPKAVKYHGTSAYNDLILTKAVLWDMLTHALSQDVPNNI